MYGIWPDDCGIVDEDVDLAEMRQRCFGGGFDGSEIGDIDAEPVNAVGCV